GLVLDGPSVPMPPPFINPEEDEREEETLTDPEHAVILKKLPEKLCDPGKFLIPCGFSELKFKALADLGASINLIPLSVWKKLGLPELISTQMTLELANREICTPKGIARDVFVLVGKFTFPTDFVIVDYESDPRVPLILGRQFLRAARALINVHGEEMILCDGKFLKICLQQSSSGNPTSSLTSLTNLTSLEVNDDIFDPEEDIIENLLNLDKTKDLPPYHDNPLKKNVKKITNASLILEDFNPPLYELPFHKEVPGLGILLLFSSENEEKVFNPGILTSKRVHTSLLPELFHQDPKVFKVINIFENPMEIFPCSYEEDIRILDVLCLHFYPP
ncbi:reverse transcriptase domain-containing protein, partial [Tanacetum coccineum]